ncbi:UPF0496 protein 3-like [Zingiber officinale]|uniref:UPF0496 protein 3-like n=1 Tax=Zingiber officinale TaxID=94328 RepID=UPI001C4CF146|nr:UPF0496 protein 3-like [Zingiber officinale]
MRIDFSLFRDCKNQVRRGRRCEVVAPIAASSFDLTEEYASAFRTESYHEFWAQVLDHELEHGAALKMPMSARRGKSVGGFLAENLLSPDQTTVSKILGHLKPGSLRLDTRALLTDYYAGTADASLLFGLLLQEIDRTRRRFRPLKAAVHSLLSGSRPSRDALRAVGDYVSKSGDARFDPFGVSQSKFQSVREGSVSLLDRLESGRKKARAKRQRLRRIRRAAASVCVVVFVASASIVGACVPIHAVVAAAALPGLVSAGVGRGGRSARRLDRGIAQLDAAARGAYILNRDLDTISRLVARLRDEAEHARRLLRLCEWGGGDEEEGGGGRWMTEEVVQQAVRSVGSFSRQLDELEEHLYLCFMTINKARKLVMQEILFAN